MCVGDQENIKLDGTRSCPHIASETKLFNPVDDFYTLKGKECSARAPEPRPRQGHRRGDYYWVRKTGGRERDFYTPKGKIVPRGARSPRPRQGLRVFSTEDPEQPEPCFAEDPEHDR